MINHIWHMDNVFSRVLIIEAIVLAGFGFKLYFERGVFRRATLEFSLVALIALAILGAYLGLTHASQRIPNEFAPLAQAGTLNAFFYLYSVPLFIALLIVPALVGAIIRRSLLTVLGLPLLFLCVFFMHWRHGFQLNTGIAQVDDRVVNPPPRFDLRAVSPALKFVENEPGVFRTVGFGSVLFPGYSGIPGVESIGGPDPLANTYYRELLLAAGVKQEWSWRWIVERANLQATLPLYNLLNVGYFLDMPGTAAPPFISGDRKRLDLDVFRNGGAWPRAFFTRTVRSYDRLEQFLAMLRRDDSHPFAAVQRGDETGVTAEASSLSDATGAAPAPVVSARDYRLTNKTTTFTIDAPAPGVAVLTEAYLAGDFRVTMNGAPVNYFRVNHAFRGVSLPEPGKYVISYSYWPRYFTASLVMAGIGAALLICWMIVSFSRLDGARSATIGGGSR